jgi:conjugative relaxase-like TrwC/TraI family protein
MLDISKPLTTNKVQSYYRAEYSAASNSYFSQGGALHGEWHGQLATPLGLNGVVSAEAFDRLAEGQHPETGEQLIQHRDAIKTQSGEEVGHRAGWDLTFNAPKTTSLTALVGDDERVREAHRNAVRAALTEAEKYVQARLGGNHPPENTAKWIAATFEHDTARPVNGYPAPHLHTHVVVFNLTEDSAGQARSLQPYELFRIQSFATAVYQNQLEAGLRQLGYPIERGLNHAPEIKGYSAEYIQAESLRNTEIQRELEKRGLSGAEAINNIKHQNRESKLNLTAEELKALHQKNAAEFGDQPARVVAAAREHHTRSLSAEKVHDRAKAAIDFARERLGERSAVFEEFEVLRDALRQAQGRIRLPELQTELERQRDAGHFVAVDHIRPQAPGARYTTPELIEIERAAIARVRAGIEQAQPIRTNPLEIEARYGSRLNSDQQQLVLAALISRDQIAGIQGGAGTGKTTALTAIKELAEEAGYKAWGLGPTSRAAKCLREAGMEAETLQAFLLRGEQPAEGSRPRLFFVDESSLASGKQMRDFLERLQPNDRVLLIGDTRQHQSVEAGRIFDELQNAGMQTAALSKIVRQKDEALRQAVEAMASGRIADGVELLRQQNRVQSFEQRGERFRAIARAFAESPQGTLVVSPDNNSRRELNAAIRSELRQSGHLGSDVFRLPVLINRQEITGEDRKFATSYRVGDVVRYTRGSELLGLDAKSYATVIESDPERNEISVQKADATVVRYDPSRVKGVALYAQEMRLFAEGDRIQFTAPWKEKAVSGRDMGTVTHLDEYGNIAIKLDDSGRTVAWNLKDHKHVDYAYAMTSHSSQGATVDRALIHIDIGDSRIRSLIDETLAYVATSRPRYDAQIFTDDAEKLAAALSRRHENATALAPEQIRSYAL